MTQTSHSVAKRRTVGQWTPRLVLATVAAVLGLLSVSDTLANSAVKADAKIALMLAPWDGKIVAKAAAARISGAGEADRSSEPVQLAQKALRLDPTAIDAMTVLGTEAQLRGDTDRARRIFSHSIKLSRREFRAQLWAIEEAVSRGDISGTLRYYDLALRTSRHAPDILFPVLASAVTEKRIRHQLIAVLKSKPAWREDFISFVGRGKSDPRAGVALFQDVELAGLPLNDSDRNSLVNALVAHAELDLAWQYYSSFKRVARNRSRDPEFSATIATPSVFDWRTRDSAGLSAVIQRLENGGAVDFSAAPSVGGVVLEQRQLLRPGVYLFQSTVADIDQPRSSLPYWVLSCDGGQDLGRVEIPSSKNGRLRVNGRFTVPATCLAQTLALVIRPTDEIAGVSGRVESASLAPDPDSERQ